VLGRAAHKEVELEAAVARVALDYLTCASTLGHARADYSARLAHRLGAGPLLPSPESAEQQREVIEQRRRQRAHEQAIDRDRFVEDRGRLQHKLKAMIKSLDGRGLKTCSEEQREDAYGIAERLREVHADVGAARSRDALQKAEDRALDPYDRAVGLLAEIVREQGQRDQIKERLRPALRARSSPTALLREMAVNMKAALPGSHGVELDALDQRSQQLLRDPPLSEAEKHRRLAAFQRDQAEIGRLINPYGY
jgi:hypothetical protein